MQLASHSAQRGKQPRSRFGCARPRGAWLGAACACAFGWVLSAETVRADCAEAGEPWIALDMQGADWPNGLRENLVADLRASLRLRGIQLCPANEQVAQDKPVALVELQISAADRVSVSIDVHDAITNKRVLRDVNLHKVAPDARALALAQAADELLRASWIELSLQDAPPPVVPPPEEVKEAVSEPLAVLTPPPKVLGARFAFEHHTGGITLLGPEAFLDLWFAERFGAAIALGVRWGLVGHAPDGRIETQAFTLSTGLAMPLWPAESRYNLVVVVAAHMAELRVRGKPTPTARGSSGSGLSITARAAISGVLRVSDVAQFTLEIGCGAPLRWIGAYDDDRRVQSTSGVALHALLGVGAIL